MLAYLMIVCSHWGIFPFYEIRVDCQEFWQGKESQIFKNGIFQYERGFISKKNFSKIFCQGFFLYYIKLSCYLKSIRSSYSIFPFALKSVRAYVGQPVILVIATKLIVCALFVAATPACTNYLMLARVCYILLFLIFPDTLSLSQFWSVSQSPSLCQLLASPAHVIARESFVNRLYLANHMTQVSRLSG